MDKENLPCVWSHSLSNTSSKWLRLAAVSECWGITKQSVRCAGCISNWVSSPNMIASLNHARLSPSLHIFTFWEKPSGFEPHSDGTSVASELFQHFTANWNWKLFYIELNLFKSSSLKSSLLPLPCPSPHRTPSASNCITMSLISVVLIANAAKVAGEKGEKVTAKSQLYLHIITHRRRRSWNQNVWCWKWYATMWLFQCIYSICMLIYSIY